MRRTSSILVFLLSLVAAANPASAQASVGRLVTFIETINVRPNGDADWVLRTEVKILDRRILGAPLDQTVASIPHRQEVQSVTAYILKKDGRKVPVPQQGFETLKRPDNAVNWKVDETRQEIHFAGAEVGDTTVTEVVQTAGTTFPGYFIFDRKAQDGFDIGERVTITTPPGMTLLVEAYDYQVSHEVTAQGTTYHLVHEGGQNPPAKGQFVSFYDRGGRAYASTFKDYDELAAAYATMLRGKSDVTPVLQAKADEITKGVTDRRLQARMLFEWIRDNIAYERLPFSDESVIPRESAADVLVQKRGDCKAQVLLYMALLKAKRIEGVMTAINATNTYSLAKPPTLAQFSHVVTWIPEFDLYADTTGRQNAFDSLPYTLYGKPVMHIGYQGPAIGRTPLRDPSQSWIASDTQMVLDQNGHVSGTVSVTSHGAAGLALQALALSDMAKDQESLAKRLLTANKMPEARGKLVLPSVQAALQSFGYTGSFGDHVVGDRGFVMPRGPAFARMEGANVIGPIAEKNYQQADPAACYPVHATENYTLTIPANKRPTRLPADRSLKTANLDYLVHWSFENQKLSVRYELTARFDSPLCGGELRKELLNQLKTIADDFNTEISLETIR